MPLNGSRHNQVWYDEASETIKEPLTPREKEVAYLAAQGFTNPQIARHLTISRETVRTHISNILSKQGITSRKDIRLGDIS